MKPHLLALFFLVTVVAESADYLPRNTQAPGEHPPTPEEALAAITVPPGFEVTLFACEPDVHQPVAMVTDDFGRIWVAESYSYKEWEKTGEDRIIILEDTDNDGVHDKRTVFWTGGNHISGMNVGWGGVWICSAPHLLFIPDHDGDDVPDGEPEIVLDGWTTKAGHNFVNGLEWGIDGWLYGRHGITQPSLVGKPGAPEEERIRLDCSIWRYHPVTKAFEVVSRGTTNPWGMDWDETGELFFTNNVNGHLWHSVPGALFPRMNNRPDPGNVFFDYERMPMTADHLHHAGTIQDWTKTRDGLGVHSDLGGGHSHCGGMIYLADNWPAKYRGRIFMSNTHGRRLNQNILERQGSAYVGKRAPDLFFANQPWFRGVSVIYGPDGGVFVSDWTDLGECHDNDGVHRTSGRIFKITYGKPAVSRDAIAMLYDEDDQLAELHYHENEWFTRKARRLLQERKAYGDDVGNAERILQRTLKGNPDEVLRIRALLTLHALDALEESDWLDLMDESSEHLRKWGVRLAVDHGAPSQKMLNRFVEAAAEEKSGLVRLYLASALQRIDGPDRWQLATALAQRQDDATDRYLPLMLWYGVKDPMAKKPLAAIAWLDHCSIPKLHRFTARLACETEPSQAVFDALLSRFPDSGNQALELAHGMLAGLEGQRNLPTSDAWPAARDFLAQSSEPELAIRLGLSLAPAETTGSLVKRVEAGDSRALELLVEARAPVTRELLANALDHPKLRKTALQGLIQIPSQKASQKILTSWSNLDATEQTAAVDTLVSTKTSARLLLDAMESQQIPRGALNAFQARQIQAMKDEDLGKRLGQIWGELKSSSAAKRDEIKHYQNQLTADVLAQGNHAHGKELYAQRCAACHSLHGEGGNIGPELTGANRTDLYYLLENIIDPSATLPRDFHVTLVTKTDGQLVMGNLAKKTDYTLTLTTPTGDVVINRDDITEQKTSPISLMPEGLLNGLEIKEVRDLIAYLMK